MQASNIARIKEKREGNLTLYTKIMDFKKMEGKNTPCTLR